MSHSDILDSRASWLRLGLSLLIATIGNVGMWAIIVIMPAMQAEFGIDRADATLPYTLTMVGFALGNLVIGRAVDRWGITRAMWGAAALIAGGFALSALAGSVLVVAVLHLVVGLGTAVSFGPLIADISHWFLRRRGIAVAVAASGNYLSGAIWPMLLGGVLADQGWRAVYLALAVIVGLSLPLLSLGLRARVPETARARAEDAAAANRRDARFPPHVLALMLGLAGLGCCMAMAMPQVHIVALSVDQGFGPAVGAEMLSLMLMGGVVSRLVSGLLADRLGGLMTLLIGSTLQCLALFLYLPAGGIVSLYLVSMVFGLSQGGIVPSYAVIVRDYMPARAAGQWVGFVMMMTVMGMALGGWVSGWIYDLTGSYQWAFLNGIAWNLLNIAIVLTILTRTRRPRTSLTPA